MEKEAFVNLYIKQNRDCFITPFDNEVGFSIIRKYPNTSIYKNKLVRIFIKVAIIEKRLFFSVNMVKVENDEKKSEYIIQSDDGSKKYTNFLSDSTKPEFIFDESSQKIKHVKKNKNFTLNQFIDVLEKNHLSDCLFWKRKANLWVNIFMKIFFWLCDRKYDKEKIRFERPNKRDNDPKPIQQEKNIEPFFKYFYISKNFIFLLLLITLFGAIFTNYFSCYFFIQDAWNNLFGEFTLSNPFVILLFFLILFTSEKISIKFNKKINDFLIPDQSVYSRQKENFIKKLDDYLHMNKFDLKI
jgi:hypothetical protein